MNSSAVRIQANITGDLIPGSVGQTLLSSLSSNLFDVKSSIRALLIIRNYTYVMLQSRKTHVMCVITRFDNDF